MQSAQLFRRTISRPMPSFSKMLSASSSVLLLFSYAFSTLATPVMQRPSQFSNITGPQGDQRYHYDGSLDSFNTFSAASGGKVNIGYFVNWGIYGRNFQPQDIATSTLTHILYSFADCDASSGAVKLTDTYADQEKHYATDSWSESGTNLYGAMKQLYLLKQANRSLKTLLSVGGWTYSQSGHFNFVTNAGARATFISTAITLLEDNGFDGIDIDFEYPSSTDQGNGLASLLSELRSALNAHAASKGDTTPYLVTAAVGAGPVGYNYLNIPQMNSALSFFNLMAYDYAGSWSTVSDDQANVYGGAITGFSTDKALTYYLEHGASASKISMGVPLYGRAFTQTTGIRQPFNGIGSGSFENGIWDYKDLPRPGSTVTEDTNNIASYCYDASSQTLVSYDTPNIAVKKAAYINSKGLAGGMYWELSNDKKGADSLVATVARELGSLDSTLNHLNYPGSKWDNIRSGMGGSPVATAAPTTTSSTSAPTGAGCSGVSAWSASAVYTAGMQVTYGGYLWTAKWWTQGETPKVQDSYPWTQVRAC